MSSVVVASMFLNCSMHVPEVTFGCYFSLTVFSPVYMEIKEVKYMKDKFLKGIFCHLIILNIHCSKRSPGFVAVSYHLHVSVEWLFSATLN